MDQMIIFGPLRNMEQLNIAKYKRRAYRKKKDLAKFVRKVGKSTSRTLSKSVKQADKETWSEIDCTTCANCCKKMTPTYNKKDINRIAAHFNMTYQQYYDKWLKLDENKDIINKSTPCQFLGRDNRCTIYAIRPDDCAEFPHFTRKDFKYQAQEKTYTNNIPFCPATLVFIEKLKAAVEAEL
jgi:Fe-S-cluster containining protein